MDNSDYNIGSRVGSSTILEIIPGKNFTKKLKLLCDCGKVFNRDWSSFKRSTSQSCGCKTITKPSGKLVYGVGFYDIGTVIREKGEKCPFKRKWVQMLHRCYFIGRKTTHPTYNQTHVAEDWLIFSNFKAWMEQQDWQDKELDKDLLGDGSIYSINTCCFLPKEVNGFMRDNNAKGYFLKDKKKYSSSVKHPVSKKKVTSGTFASLEEATEGWRKTKRKIAEEIIEHFSLEDRLAEALRKRYD